MRLDYTVKYGISVKLP